MAHDRNQICIKQLPQFLKYLDLAGVAHRPGKGEFQLAQVQVGKDWPAICRNASDVVTTPVELRPLLTAFKSTLFKPQTSKVKPLPAPLAPSIKEENELYCADLRDDVAMRLFIAKMERRASNGGDMADDEAVSHIAKRAFHHADIFLKAGGHA